MTIEEKKQKYLALAHAMQTGVAYKLERDNRDTTPKHLRVGVNSAMVDTGALVTLLIKKGVFTEDEWWDALIERMQAEVTAYETALNEMHGGTTKIKLG